MLDIGGDLRPRKRPRLDRALEDNTYLTTLNNSPKCNSIRGDYINTAPSQDPSQPAPTTLSNVAHTKNIYSQTWSYNTTHTIASETYITHSTRTVQSSVAKYVRPTLTPDVSQIDAFAKSGYGLVSSEISPKAEICFGAVGYPFIIYQYRTI